MTSYSLNSDQIEKISFSLPAGWIPLHPIKENNNKPSIATAEMASKALEKAAGLIQFSNNQLMGNKISIIVDDGTRPTPVKDILPVLLKNLKQKNATEDHISIIIAAGSHASMPDDALKNKLGEDIVAHYKVIQHNAQQKDLVPLEVPEAGMTVKVNPAVINADIKIGISSILPHPFAGYGGGPKILMPGVCDRDSLVKHHMINAVHKRARAGITEGNPFQELCMKIAEKIGLDFSINCVYDKHGNIADIVAGTLENAFNEAVDICLQKLGYRVKEKADITICSTYPHTHGIQFCKGLGTPKTITRESGAIILFAPVKNPLPDDFVNAVDFLRNKYGENVAGSIRKIMSEGKMIFDDKSPEFNMALYDLLGRPKVRTLLYAPMIPAETAIKLGFEYMGTIDEGLFSLKKSYPKATVAVLPAGGLIIPV
ncbi:MAG: DUF2088 domain-containing protein [Spirochaetes bacterium]|nr:DUF2088 domain-containing protein [Spirochaetota bacterium]